MIERWGALVARRSWTVLIASVLLVAAAAAYGGGVFDSLSNGGFDDPASEGSKELTLERETFGNKAIDVVAIYSSDELLATDPEFKAEVEQTLAEVPEAKVTSVVTWYDAQDPSMISEDKRAIQVLISLSGDTQDEFGDNYEAIEPSLRSDELTTDLAGPWANYVDVNNIVSEDLARAEAISLPVVLLLSLIIFGSAVAASMPVIVGIVSVLGGLAIVRVLTGFTEVSVFSVNIITLLGMGLAIDYALFVVSRFREELAHHPETDPDGVRLALVKTMSTAGRTVLFSGLTVAAAMSSLLVFPQAFLKSIGYGGIAAVLVAMVAALTVLPAILGLLGRRIDAWKIPLLNRRSAKTVDEQGAGWARLARAVMRRPLASIGVIVVALLALGSPFLGVSWGSVDHRVLPDDAPAHVAADKLNSDFGPERSTANVLLTGASDAEVAAYSEELGELDGMLGVTPVDSVSDAAGGSVLLRAAWEGNSQSEDSQQMIQDIRAVETPAGSDALVGGLAADTVDLLDSVGAKLPWMGLIVVGVMLVLLFVAFGSLILPIKAVLMNALSITASFGVVTWIFADGHFENLLGFTSSGYLDATQPILMLAILFGLSMDYEVFLLSRVREQWDRTHDNDLAVVTGVQKSGRIITSAALLLAVVIGAFGLSGIVFMKMLGVGMLLAILIDATIIRAILVPATMKLLGDWNWWAPGPLRRWWERFGFREESAGESAPQERAMAAP